MGMEAIVALVVAITQLGKSWIKTWFSIADEQWKKWYSVAVSFVASVGVVIYDAMEISHVPVNLKLLLTAFVAFALANGAKKIISTLKPK